MTQTAEQRIAALEGELAEWKALAREQSDLTDQAVAQTVALTGVVVAQKAAAPPAPAPPIPPAPAIPPPPRPSSVPAYYALSSSERARVRAAHGEDIEERLDEAFHNKLRIGNANRGGSENHHIGTFGANRPLTVAEAQDKARADLAAFQATAPRPFFKGTQAAATAESLAAAMTASMHGGARPAPAKAAPAPTKARHLGAARR
jgi:hypothetical protein